MKTKRGFTFVEVLVVVSVIAVLAAIIFAGMSEVRKKARDAERKSDLKLLQAAVELYKNENGQYPAGCRGAGVWSGQIGTTYACADGSNQYIVGLAPKYISVLPNDSQLNGTDSGYVYTTNTERTVYKIQARKTVEGEIVDYNNEFKICDATDSAPVACSEDTQPPDPANAATCDIGMCDRVRRPSSFNKQNHCSEGDALFQTSYAVWGGYAGAVGTSPTDVAQLTEDIVCEIP